MTLSREDFARRFREAPYTGDLAVELHERQVQWLASLAQHMHQTERNHVYQLAFAHGRDHALREAIPAARAKITGWLRRHAIGADAGVELLDEIPEHVPQPVPVNEEWQRERDLLVILSRRHELDNHHNAALCPYCSPDQYR